MGFCSGTNLHGISFSPEELWIAGGWKIITGEVSVFVFLRCFARGALMDSAGGLSSPVGVSSIPSLPEGNSSSVDAGENVI